MRRFSAYLLYSVLFIIIVAPILLLLVWSFTGRWPWPQALPNNLTMRAWQDIYRQRGRIAEILGLSVFISMAVGLLSVLIGSMTARALMRLDSKYQQSMSFMLSLPMLIPATIFGMGIQVEFINWGINNSVIGVILAHLVYSLPYANFLLIDAFNHIGLELQEQAKVLGANTFQTIRYITLPLLLPIMLSAFIMAYIVSFSQYFLTLLVGGGSIQTYSIMMFPYLLNNDRTVASSYGLIFLLFTLVIFLLFRWVTRVYLAHVTVRK